MKSSSGISDVCIVRPGRSELRGSVFVSTTLLTTNSFCSEMPARRKFARSSDDRRPIPSTRESKRRHTNVKAGFVVFSNLASDP